MPTATDNAHAGVECTVRAAVAADLPGIREVNRRAFRMEVAGTFERLLAAGDVALGFVAVAPAGDASAGPTASERVLGHVIFTSALIELPGREVAGMGLGELAVLPELQRRGIGTRLGTAGLAALRAAGCPFCIVVGHAAYYPRLGFVRGSRHGIACQWPKVPDESFMIAVLDGAVMQDVRGTARFRDVA